MPIPMEPMDSIALDVFYYPSTSHDREEYDRKLLCVCSLSGYLIAILSPKTRHGMAVQEHLFYLSLMDSNACEMCTKIEGHSTSKPPPPQNQLPNSADLADILRF